MAKLRIEVDLDSPQEVTDQLRQQIIDKVRIGRVYPGNSLPTVRQIALDTELNANTVARMLKQLEQEGTVMYRDGAGFYCIDLRQDEQHKRAGAFDV
jgi:GntR family transcriptional regulator